MTGLRRNRHALLLSVVPGVDSVNIKCQEAKQREHDEGDIDGEINTELIWKKAWSVKRSR